MSGGNTPTTTTQIQKTELPAWVDAASQGNYAQAQQVADRPFQQYQGPTVAGLSQGEKNATGILQQSLAGTGGAFGQAQSFLTQAGGYTPQTVAAPGAVGNVTAGNTRDVSAYLNPNLDAVVNPTLANLDRASAATLQANDDASRSQGAWGSSRSGVQQAVLQSENIRNKAATEGQLRYNAYGQAQGAAQADNQTALQAALANQSKDVTGNAQQIQVGTANQSAGLAGAQLGLSAGTALTGLGDSITNSGGKNALLSAQLGATDRGIAQAGLDADKAKFDAAQQAPVDALNIKLAALGMSPYGKSTSTNETKAGGTSSNPLMTGIGAASTILPLIFSDRDTKKEIKRVGKVEGTDLNKYEYKYKKGFMGRDMPTAVGLMADDVEKKVPGAVHRVKVSGKTVKAVDYAKATAGAHPFMGGKRRAA